MELIYLQTKSNRFTLPQSCMRIHPSPINALVNTSDTELLFPTSPNETMQCCFVAYEWLGKLISSRESH